MEFTAAWKRNESLELEDLFLVTRSVLVHAAITMLKAEFEGFDSTAEATIVADELTRHITKAGPRLPETSRGHATRPWMRGCALKFKTFSAQADREDLQPHDHFRLYQVREQSALASGAKGATRHAWEVSGRVNWTKEPGLRRVDSMIVGLLGTTPERSGRDREVRGILDGIDLRAGAGLPSVGLYLGDPRRNLLGDGITYAIGWSFRREEFASDGEVVSALAQGAVSSWRGLHRALRGRGGA